MALFIVGTPSASPGYDAVLNVGTSNGAYSTIHLMYNQFAMSKSNLAIKADGNVTDRW